MGQGFSPCPTAALLLFPLPLRKITRPPFCSAPLLRPSARGFPLPRGKPTQSKEDGKKAGCRKRVPVCNKSLPFFRCTLLCFGFAAAGRPRAGPSVRAFCGRRALSAQARQTPHFSLFQMLPLVRLHWILRCSLCKSCCGFPRPCQSPPRLARLFMGRSFRRQKRVWAQKIRLLGKEPDFSFL